MDERTQETGAEPDRRRADGHKVDGFEWLRTFGSGPLADRMGIEWLEASADRLVATMPVDGNTQPHGLLHGGALAVLAETLGSVGAQLHAGDDRMAVGIELSCSHHRAVSAGTVTGVATPIHLGRSVATYEIAISDDQGRRVCTSRLTCMVRPASPNGSVAAFVRRVPS